MLLLSRLRVSASDRLILEKGLPGKEKACGDAWIPSAVEELRSFHIGKPELSGNWHPFSQMDGYYAERKVWSHNLFPSEAVVASRAVVDQLLRDRVSTAGCEIWFGARATGLRVLGQQLYLTIRRGEDTLTLTPSPPWSWPLVAAVVSRAAEDSTARAELGASVSAYLPTDGNIGSPRLVFGDPSPGYGWVFPMGANASNAGVCALLSEASALRFHMKTLAARLGVSGSLAIRGGLGALWSGKGTVWSHDAGVVAAATRPD